MIRSAWRPTGLWRRRSLLQLADRGRDASAARAPELIAVAVSGVAVITSPSEHDRRSTYTT
jgi:hypothetical protein